MILAVYRFSLEYLFWNFFPKFPEKYWHWSPIFSKALGVGLTKKKLHCVLIIVKFFIAALYTEKYFTEHLLATPCENIQECKMLFGHYVHVYGANTGTCGMVIRSTESRIPQYFAQLKVQKQWCQCLLLICICDMMKPS